jgi:hypothetical protein
VILVNFSFEHVSAKIGKTVLANAPERAHIMNILQQHDGTMVMHAPRGTASQPRVIPLLLACMISGLSPAGLGAAGVAASPQSAIDNERILASEVRDVQAPAAHDFVSVSLTHPGTAVFGHKGVPPGADARSVLIELKDHPVEPLANTTPYPLAFPRPGVKKLLENERVVVWQYTWRADQPTPMHFHDKDVLVVFEGNGTLKSTTPAGTSTDSTYKFGDVRFNRRDRVHSETLVSGDLSAVMTELK